MTVILVTAMMEATSMYATYFSNNYDLCTNDFIDVMGYLDKENLYHFHELKAQRALKKHKNVCNNRGLQI